MRPELMTFSILERPERVALEGGWARRERDGAELVEWNGRVISGEPLAGVLFVSDGRGELRWTKSAPAAPSPELRVSFSGWVAQPREAMFRVTFHGAFVPFGPVVTDDASCALPQSLQLGRVEPVAACGGVEYFLLLLPGAALRVGRNHLWRARDEVVVALPERQRTLLTRRRTGTLSATGGTTSDASSRR